MCIGGRYMEKKTVNIDFAGDLGGIERAEKMERKRVNIVLDEDIHGEGIKLAESLRMDFSALVNLMLEAALSAEERDNMVASMYATILRRRGFIVTKNSGELRGDKRQDEHVQKGKKGLKNKR
jgi:hypothetical protein